MQILDKELKPILLDYEYELANCFETLFDAILEPDGFNDELSVGFELLESSKCLK